MGKGTRQVVIAIMQVTHESESNREGSNEGVVILLEKAQKKSFKDLNKIDSVSGQGA